ncbi:unnamed protein product [Brassica oleracea]
MQLLFPIDEFYVGYVMPFGFIFSYIFLCEMIIGVINYPGNHRFFNSY